MLKFFNGEEHQKILILNYNTILIQSIGFLNYMSEVNNYENKLSSFKDVEFIVSVLQYVDKNTASLIDDTIDSDFYFNFIKEQFLEVSNFSPLGVLQYHIEILAQQNFVSEIHIASPIDMNMKEIFNSVTEPVFDIFDANMIVGYINKHGITSLFIHDIELMKEIIEHPDMDSEQFTYILSKIGYNYIEIEDAAFFKLPEIMDLKDDLNFLIGVANLISDEEEENIIL